MLDWRDDGSFVLADTTFRTLTTFEAMPQNVGNEDVPLELADGEFFVFKPRPLVDAYVELVERVRPRRVFELGFFGGGSTLLLAELARPERLVCIDRMPLERNRARMEARAAARGLGGVVRTYGEVDQSDRRRLAEIADEAFGGAPLDLVVDDCSHRYEPTLASFNELFPRLRPGGVYAIEDWRWAHTAVGHEPLDGWFPDEVPLTRLLFEALLAVAGAPDLVRDVSIETRLALITRGEGKADPATFDLAACSNPRGRSMIA